ncbi:MAG: thioredoxin-disulfide reductase [Candidatus Margulisiibacteriota bacterium]
MNVLRESLVMPKLEAIIKEKEVPFEVIIIGGGPAGLTAAVYCGRAGFSTLLIEKAILGGQLAEISEIENYPGFPSGISGIELSGRLEDQAKKFGCNIIFGDVIKIENEGPFKKVVLADRVFKTKAVIIATGTEPKKLGIPGEDIFRGRGVSYCATCDGAFYRDKTISVIGGGNSAISESIFLTRFASKVIICHRREVLRADKILADRALDNPKIFIKWNFVPEKIGGSDKVESLEIKNVLDGKKDSLKVDGVFIYIGEDPNSSFLEGTVKMNKEGFITTDSSMASTVPGIFAAGDIREKTLRQISTAVSDGAIAADSARRRLENMV